MKFIGLTQSLKVGTAALTALLSVSDAAHSQESNALFRLVCFETERQGDPNTVKPGFLAVTQQLEGLDLDVREFFEGTLQQSETPSRINIPAVLHLFDNVPDVSKREDHKELVDGLLSAGAVDRVTVSATRSGAAITMTTDNDSHFLSYRGQENQATNIYIGPVFSRFIFCFPPYSIDES